ncbi:MAG: hypothetical protein JNK87_38925 [Bryobacterales bacterium]|nr:hypothetical protein [Bryobacterales bacterium]
MLHTGWLLAAGLAYGQVAYVVPAPEVRMPAPIVDGNSPGVWVDGQLRVYTSTGAQPMAMSGADITSLTMTDPPVVTPATHYPLWIEAVWQDNASGNLYAWYHHEPGDVCGGRLSAPKIGALVSSDGGRTFADLGIVLSSGDPLNCSAPNGFFAGGHGDFSVITDRDGAFLYFLFTNYGGAASTHGIAIARIAVADLASPVGAVWKYSRGNWESPGVGGALTPVMAARVGWDRENTDSYWGPAIHWNVHLQNYVVLLNRACCEPGWPQEGIYLSYGSDLADPGTWTTPAKLIDEQHVGFAPAYYPQAFGSGPDDTDTQAGQLPRLFVKGYSAWQIYFAPSVPPDPLDPVDPVDPGGEEEAVAPETTAAQKAAVVPSSTGRVSRRVLRLSLPQR